MNPTTHSSFILHPSSLLPIRIVFAAFVLLALLGDARIVFFILNRVVFGGHRHEQNSWWWLMIVVPPALLLLTALFWPIAAEQWIFVSAASRIGAAWLIVAATIGLYWILDRLRANAFPPHAISGVRTLEPEVIRSERRHVVNAVYDLEVTRHEIFVDDLSEALDGYRIAFLTDPHVSPSFRRDFYRQIAAQVQKFDPHLILLGGDFVTWQRHIPLIAPLLLADLRARDGIFAVLGNHDYWAGAGAVADAMRTAGVKFLINASEKLPLQIVGIDEIYRGDPDVERAFEGIDPAQPCIAVSHHPDVIDLLGARRLDLLLCGHTHGGQIRFPFFGAVVVPSRHEAAYASGFHRLRNVLLYVSRGVGAVPPVRILCRPELATFTLRRGSRGHDRETVAGLA